MTYHHLADQFYKLSFRVTRPWVLALLAILALLLLQGCAGFAARGLSDAQALHARASEAVAANLDVRKKIRTKCEEILWDDVEKLVRENKSEEAKKLLWDSYPPLYTVDLVLTVARKEKGLENSILSKPYLCQTMEEKEKTRKIVEGKM